VSEMTPVFPRLRKFYLLGNGLAIVILLVAGLLNLIIGPRNPAIFLVVVFQLVYAWLVLVVMDAVNRQRPEKSLSLPFWVHWVGRGPAKTWKRDMARNRLDTSVAFLCFTPTFFLIVALLIFYAVVTGTINPF
jgi:hypothetical protein